MVMVTVYSCFVTPARIAFGDATITPSFIIDALIDVIYLTDIILTFHTGPPFPSQLQLRILNISRDCEEWSAQHEAERRLESLPPGNILTRFPLCLSTGTHLPHVSPCRNSWRSLGNQVTVVQCSGGERCNDAPLRPSE